MSRILFINVVCNGSTGTICKNLYKAAEGAGHTCCIAYGRGDAPEGFNVIKIGNPLDIYLHVLKARLFDASGFGSKKATKDFIKKIEEFKPDIIHLHNIHGYYLNIEILYNYLKQHPEIKKIWTLHDCWAYTGHCVHYTYAQCNKWKTECSGNCPNCKEYPQTIFSNIKSNFDKKKEIFNGVDNMILITPSNWLKNEVKKSYLNQYKVEAIHNGIDTDTFKSLESNLREEYNLGNKKIILGVAAIWDKRKGLDTFIQLSKELDSSYQIVLIGLNDKQIEQLPDNILGIKRTENALELAKWYSTANVFFNASIEETFGMTTAEAVSCGTPVLVYNSSALPEVAKDNGVILDTNEVYLVETIEDMIQNSRVKHDFDFSLDNMLDEYKKLYLLSK